MNTNNILVYKNQILDNIYINTTKQLMAIENENLENFESLLSEREELITELLTINNDNNIIDDDIRIKIQKICELDNKISIEIKKLQENINNDFKKMNVSKKVVTQGYVNYSNIQQSYFIDKKN